MTDSLLRPETPSLVAPPEVPAISVVMAVYNSARYLPDAVESVLQQTFTNFELLILDDGSTDTSVKIVEQFARGDQRIRFFRETHRGYVPCLNEGLQRARCELVARMDSDDIALPHRLETQKRYLDRHPECIVVGSQVLMIDAQGDPIAASHNPLSHEEIDQRHLEGGNGGSKLCHPSVMMRRSAVLAAGGYDERFMPAEDLELFLRLAEQPGRLENLPEILLHYRLHCKSVSISRRVTQLDSVVAAVEAAHRRRGLPATADPRATFPQNTSQRALRNWMIRAALRSGHWRTARKHALLELARRPWSPWAWKVAGRTAFGWWADSVYP